MPDFSAFAGRACPAWYRRPQLGIFVHWGVFAMPAYAPRGEPINEIARNDYDNLFARAPYSEWYANALRLPGSATAAHHAEVWGDRPYESFKADFEAAAAAFDADAWADLFAGARAGYVVMVTKHHDGYCLWPSGVGNPHRADWRSGRDFVGELAQAVRRRGTRFGVYYSGGLDWTFEARPIADMGDMLACVPLGEDYRAYAAAQVRELIARYRPSVLWNDIAWPDGRDLPGLFGDYYAAVPDGVVNDRWTGERALFEGLRDEGARKGFNTAIKAATAAAKGELAQPAPPHSDFRTVEYGAGAGMGETKWESTRGLGLGFGFNANERPEDYMSSEALNALYDDVTARGGNLLINVGPRADASIPPKQAALLRALGQHLSA
ncbi:MAG TPA: alpha-L-fucosidase [Caulobacteraceae bacterium]|nr:alpha-L-fucosidase [Caulobacteraceae bacterium]